MDKGMEKGTDKTIAADVMSSDLITIRKGQTVEEALKLLVNYKITGVPVVDAEGRMIGVLSEYDIILQIDNKNKSNKAARNKPKIGDRLTVDPECFQEAAEFTGDPFFLPRSTPLDVLLKHFVESKYRRIPIVDEDQKLVGIGTRRDLMRIYFYRAKLS